MDQNSVPNPISPPPAFELFERREVEQSIIDRFDRSVRRWPERIAVRGQAVTWSYRELSAEADRVAAAFRASTGPSAEPVGLLLDQSPALVASILGTLRAGHFYVPLDPSYPEPVLSALWSDAGGRLLVTDSPHRPLAARLGSATPLVVEELAPATVPGGRVPGPDDLAYIYYTSGTTGRPKGLVDTHRNVLHNILRYTNGLYLASDDRLSLVQSPMFSGMVSSLFGALLNGATVCLYDVAREGARGIGPWIERELVSVYHSVPSIFRSFLRAAGADQRFASVRVVRLEGDRATPQDVALFRHHFAPRAVLSHGLGATECGLVCRFALAADAPFESPVVPIGYPAEGVTVHILDAAGRAAPRGEAGELVVESRYLSPGYWKRPDLTARVFAEVNGGDARRYRTGDVGRIRDDGCVEHLGRVNHQPKVRGQRVDTEAMEAALIGTGLVADAAVEIRRGPLDEGRLTAYCVTHGPARPNVTVLRRELARTLAPHLVPARFLFLDRLPVTAHGKVDRVALPDPDRARPELATPYIAVESELEAGLAGQFREVLDLEPIGLHDDFFDLGGDSLSAIALLERIATAHGVDLAPQVLFDSPTIMGLAAAIEAARSPQVAGAPSRSSRPLLVAVQAAGRRPPFHFLHAEYGGDGFYCLALARRLGSDQPFFALSPHGRDGGAMPPSIEAMAAAYVRSIRRQRPHGPYRLGGFCSSAVVAWEVARQLTRQRECVELLVIVEPPDIGRTARWQAMHATFGLLAAATGNGADQRSAWMAAAMRRIRHGKRPRLRDLRRVVARLRRPAPSPPAGQSAEQRRVWIAKTYDAAVRAHRPERFDGPVLCVRARDVSDPIDVAPWRRLAGSFTDCVVPGDHNSCILEHVDTMAEAIGRALAPLPGATS